MRHVQFKIRGELGLESVRQTKIAEAGPNFKDNYGKHQSKTQLTLIKLSFDDNSGGDETRAPVIFLLHV